MPGRDVDQVAATLAAVTPGLLTRPFSPVKSRGEPTPLKMGRRLRSSRAADSTPAAVELQALVTPRSPAARNALEGGVAERPIGDSAEKLEPGSFGADRLFPSMTEHAL